MSDDSVIEKNKNEINSNQVIPAGPKIFLSPSSDLQEKIPDSLRSADQYIPISSTRRNYMLHSNRKDGFIGYYNNCSEILSILKSLK